MRFRLAMMMALLVLFPAAAQAQAERIDPAKEADVRHLIELTSQSIKISDIMRSMIPQVRAMTAEYQKSMPPEQVEKFNRVMDHSMEKAIARMEQEMPKLLEAMVPAYTKHLSHEDIRAIIQFYESPAGKHMIEAMPLITQESFAAMAPLLQKMNKDLMDEMFQDLKKEFPDLPLPQKGSTTD